MWSLGNAQHLAVKMKVWTTSSLQAVTPRTHTVVTDPRKQCSGWAVAVNGCWCVSVTRTMEVSDDMRSYILPVAVAKPTFSQTTTTSSSTQLVHSFAWMLGHHVAKYEAHADPRKLFDTCPACPNCLSLSWIRLREYYWVLSILCDWSTDILSNLLQLRRTSPSKGSMYCMNLKDFII